MTLLYLDLFRCVCFLPALLLSCSLVGIVCVCVCVCQLEDVAENRKILREVTTVSRLYHRHIVRYYQAWLEGGRAAAGGDGSDFTQSDEDDSEYSDEDDEDSDDDDWMLTNSRSSAGM